MLYEPISMKFSEVQATGRSRWHSAGWAEGQKDAVGGRVQSPDGSCTGSVRVTADHGVHFKHAAALK
jgi:hypothetical protein